MPLPDGALWWRLLKKSKNSHCLCAIAVLRNGVKIVARRASPVTDAVARNSLCFKRILFVFVCDVKRVLSARGKGRTRIRRNGFADPNYIVCAYDFWRVYIWSGKFTLPFSPVSKTYIISTSYYGIELW